MNKLVLLLVVTLPLASFSQSNDEQGLAQIFEVYKKASYVEAIDLAKKLRTSNKKIQATSLYLRAISEARLQSYEQAIRSFTSAIKLGAKADDIFYEYGQALYAANELELSRKSFARSAKANYKKSTSLYYMGHISQILEEYKKAKSYYQRVLKTEKDDKNLRQVARFQLSESLISLGRGKKNFRRIVRKYIIPQMKKAKAVNTKTPTASEIQKRITEIQNEFNLDPSKMINGRSIPKKRYSLSLTQNISYDSNVTLSNDLPTITATKEDSFIYNTSLSTNYKYILKRRYTIKPALSLTKQRHNEQEKSTVFTNDNYSVSPSVQLGFDYSLFSKKATILFDYSYSYKGQDYQLIHEKNFFSRTSTYSLGHKFNFYGYGDTTLKFKKKTYRSHSETLHNNVSTLSIDHVHITKKGHLIIALLSFDQTDYFNNTSTNTDSTLLRVDYLMPEFFTGIMLSGALSLNFLDTLEQSQTRGTEKTYTPSMKLTKKIGKYLTTDLNYEYAKTTSLSSANEYSKHTTSWGLNFSL